MRTLIVLAVVLAIALAEGQFYVPRAYYTIDSAGHESMPIPLRRLRRSYNPNPRPTGYPGGGSWSNSESGANAWSNAGSGSSGGWMPPPPPGGYGASAPSSSPGHVYGVSGTFDAAPVGAGLGASPSTGRYVSSSASIGVNSNGLGQYATSVGTYP